MVQSKAHPVIPPQLQLVTSPTAFLPLSVPFSFLCQKWKRHKLIDELRRRENSTLCVEQWEDHFCPFLPQSLCVMTTFPFRSKAWEWFMWLLIFYIKRCFISITSVHLGEVELGLLMLGANTNQKKKKSPTGTNKWNTMHQVASGYCGGQSVIWWNHLCKLGIYSSLGEKEKRADRRGLM